MSTSLIQTRPLRSKKTTTTVAPLKQDENVMKAIAKKPSTTTVVTKRTAFGEITNVVANAPGVKDNKKDAIKPKEVVIANPKKAVVPQKASLAISMETEQPKHVFVPHILAPVEVAPVPMDSEDMEVEINKALLLQDDPDLDAEFKDVDDEVEDIDAGDVDDPKFCSEYVTEIMDYLFLKEQQDLINPNYMQTQVEITEKHRAILVDWMSEVALKFKLLTETFFLSINIMDRFLQQKPVARAKLQLVGVTAMLIASKFEEIYTPEVKDFILITAKTYTREEILKMERLILVTLDFNLGTPTSIHFVRRFSKAAKYDSTAHTLAKYLVEMSLLEYRLLKFPYSLTAAAAVFLARKMTEPELTWNATLQHYTQYDEDEVVACARELNSVLKAQPESKFKAIYKKYASPKLLAVADIAPVDL